jgi:adenylate cyclase
MNFRLKPLHKALLIAAAVAGGLAAMKGADLSPVASLRHFTFDTLQRLSPRPYTDMPVRVVDIDERSLRELGQWPWPRTQVAALVDRLRELGAATVAFDMVFPEPDRTSPARYAQSLETERPDVDPRVTAALELLPDHDQVLAGAVRKVPVVLGFVAVQQRNELRPFRKSGYAFAGADPKTILPPFQGAIVNIEVLEQAASGLGSISLGQDSASERVRQIPLLLSDGGQIYSGLVLEALRAAQGASSVVARSTGASRDQHAGRPALVELRVGQFPVPLTAEGELFLYYDRDRPERSLSARDVLDRSRGEEIRKRVEGHIVFVGTSAAGLLDRRITALGETVAGVTIHAQAAEQILSQTFLRRPDWANGLETVLTVMAGALVAVLLVKLGARFAAPVLIGVVALLSAGGWLSFAEAKLLLDPVFPAISVLAVYLAVTGWLYLTSDRDKRFVRRAFGRYLAPELLQKLEAAPERLRLGGEIRPMTVMFMDIRGFTPISERLSPQELVSFLNVLFSPLTDAIQRQQGIVDKYIGDSIMAFWNAPVDVPDHAARACAAALEMRDIVERLNRSDAFGFRASGSPDLVVEVGIGINTGEACVGNMGSETRFNYSVVGDTVNIAARIEGDCKRAGVSILLSEETVRAAPQLAVLEAGAVSLKGKSNLVRLFALVGDSAVAASPDFQALAHEHRRLLDALEARRGEEALERLLACRVLGGEALSGFYRSFMERVRALGNTTEVLRSRPMASISA